MATTEIEYKILEVADDAQQLAKSVNQHIRNGWRPIGGVGVGVTHPAGYWYYQAMVRQITGARTSSGRKTKKGGQ